MNEGRCFWTSCWEFRRQRLALRGRSISPDKDGAEQKESISEDCMSAFLGFEIERDASNQLICIRCRKYVPWSCWAKEGGCDCEDIRVRFFALHAWIQAGGRSANWDRRSARRSSYEPHYATYLRKEIKESQDSFFRKQRDFLKLQEKI